jgi:hypothetical protein
MSISRGLLGSAIAVALIGAAEGPSPRPPGEDKSARTRLLEAGAKVLQGNSPLAPMDVYLVGFHPMKDHPDHQMEAHHFCHQLNEDFAQCALFDGNTRQAKLTGIEYINRDGEARPGLVEQRDQRMGMDSARKRRERADLQPLARPQSGVDALKPAFPQARPIPGVVDAGKGG